MCLVLLAVDCHPRHRLIVAANRDELYARRTARLSLWPGPAGIAAGVDLEAGGTWMAASRSGRFAAVTNYRDPRDLRPKEPGELSRGALVRDFVEGAAPPAAHLAELAKTAHLHRGFNLLAGDRDALYWYSNRHGEVLRVEPGFHGLSNHLLDTPWPKVSEGLSAFRRVVEAEDAPDEEALFRVLADTHVPPDDSLPDTGIGLERERLLGPRFIRMPGYGTRCSTLLLAGRDGATTILERTTAPEPLGDTRVVLAG
jgi:uncharacterized protein with NRDE domain